VRAGWEDIGIGVCNGLIGMVMLQCTLEVGRWGGFGNYIVCWKAFYIGGIGEEGRGWSTQTLFWITDAVELGYGTVVTKVLTHLG